MRDRLIEMLGDYLYSEQIADHLIANGVIVPPCKVGDMLWDTSVTSNRVYSKVIEEISIHEKDGDIGKYVYADGVYFPFESFGETIFLTREEAEKALKEREGK